jgi:transcriptional regulator with XRE-family HTH domain
MEEGEGEYRARGIAERLRLARERRGLTQAELCERAGVDRKSCFNIENDKMGGNVRFRTVERLASALQVPAGWLAFGTDDSKVLITGLLQEFVAVQQDQVRLSNEPERRRLGDFDWDDEEDDDDEDEDEDEDAEAEEQKTDKMVKRERPENEALSVWPLGFRPVPIGYAELPPLLRHYEPVLFALGPGLSYRRRVQVARLLVYLLWVDEEERDDQAERVEIIRKLLLTLLQDRDLPLVDLVVHDLNSPDPWIRGKMALSLIIDGGLPVSLQDLVRARNALPEAERTLYRAANLAFEIIDEAAHPEKAAEWRKLVAARADSPPRLP